MKVLIYHLCCLQEHVLKQKVMTKMTHEDLDTSTDVAWEILSIALQNEDDNDLAEVLFSKAAAILKQNHLDR